MAKTDPQTITLISEFLDALRKDREFREDYMDDPDATVTATNMADPSKLVVRTGDAAAVNAALAMEPDPPKRQVRLQEDIQIDRYIHY